MIEILEDIEPAVVVQVFHRAVERVGTVVADIPQKVSVPAGLVGVGDGRAVVTTVSHPVSVRVDLIRVVNPRTIVDRIDQTVAV